MKNDSYHDRSAAPEKLILDYERPPRGDALWFRLLVLFGCLLGIGIIVAIVIDRILYG